MDKLVLLLGGETRRFTKWVAYVDWTTGSSSGSIKIDVAGKPFQTAPRPNSSTVPFFGNGDPWIDGKTGQPFKN